MHIELSEVLVCPSCGPDANLVLAVDERDGRWVRSGTLACARCDGRYPVRDGSVDLGAGPPGEGAGAPEPEEAAMEVGALLELPSRPGVVLLGPGLAPAAPRIASMAERAEVLLVAGGDESGSTSAGPAAGGRGPASADGEEGRDTRHTRLEGAGGGRLPLRERRFTGVALWSPDASRLREAAALLRPGGRLVGLRPGPEARRALEELEGEAGLEVLASEARALVAVRPA